MSTQANITVLDINDNSPRFTSPEVFYSWTNDTVIGNVQATDDDSGSRISYFLATPSNYILLDYQTGSLSLNRKYWKLKHQEKLDLKLGRFDKNKKPRFNANMKFKSLRSYFMNP